MSWYTVFDQLETTLTSSSTATAVLSPTDLTIVHNNATGRKFAVPVRDIANPGVATIATTLTTATNIGPTGITLLKSTGGTSCDWLLTDPSGPGYVKTLAFVSSTTSTRFSVSPVAASIQSTAGLSGTMVNFGTTATGTFINAGQSVTMVSLSTTSWAVIATNRNATSVSSFIFALGNGPVYS